MDSIEIEDHDEWDITYVT
jgi:1-phosphatidylinositol-4-phosphate 5-kinase